MRFGSTDITFAGECQRALCVDLWHSPPHNGAGCATEMIILNIYFFLKNIVLVQVSVKFR
jgi:hypothetical protein